MCMGNLTFTRYIDGQREISSNLQKFLREWMAEIEVQELKFVRGYGGCAIVGSHDRGI